MVLLLLALAPLAHAETRPARASGWQVEERTDAMTDRVTRTACTTNNEGYRLCILDRRLAREAGRGVFLRLVLAPQIEGLLDRGRLPWLRVDRNRVHDDALLAHERLLENRQIIEREVAGRSVLWAVQVAEDDVFHREIPGILGELVAGRSLRIRYFLIDGEHTDTLFDLAGIEPVLAAIGIRLSDGPLPPNWQPATLEAGGWRSRGEAERALPAVRDILAGTGLVPLVEAYRAGGVERFRIVAPLRRRWMGDGYCPIVIREQRIACTLTPARAINAAR